MKMPDRFREGIRLFNRGEYFECHEMLEAVWTPERGARRLFLQSLIHIAVGFYHHGRGNSVGAVRQLRKALRKLGAYLPECDGIDTARLHREAEAVLREIESGSDVAAYPRIHMRTHGRRRTNSPKSVICSRTFVDPDSPRC
jgi:predicted metal-dependent hydrolase